MSLKRPSPLNAQLQPTLALHNMANCLCKQLGRLAVFFPSALCSPTTTERDHGRGAGRGVHCPPRPEPGSEARASRSSGRVTTRAGSAPRLPSGHRELLPTDGRAGEPRPGSGPRSPRPGLTPALTEPKPHRCLRARPALTRPPLTWSPAVPSPDMARSDQAGAGEPQAG